MKKTLYLGSFLCCLGSISFGQFNTPWTTTTSNATNTGYIGIGLRPTSTSTILPSFNFQVHGTADYITSGGTGGGSAGIIQNNGNDTVINENYQHKSLINHGKTVRLGLTNSVTGTGSSDGTVLTMSQNNFMIKNQEIGDFTLSTNNFSVLLHNSSRRIWVGGTPSSASTYGRLNLIGADNGLYIETLANRKGLIIKNHSDASTAIEIFGANATLSNFRVYASGLVRAREVIIDLASWPDYVFTPSYKLKTLKEIEEFINKHGHLPGVPSAEEVANEGVSLGEMNKILLEKIEELTLHLIEQQKRIEALETKK